MLLASWNFSFAGSGWSFVLASIGFVASWGLYFRNTRFVEPPYHWLLPTLRSAAIAWVILLLAEPTFETVSILGKPTELHILLDQSESMLLPDAVAAENARSEQNAAARRINAAIRLLNRSDGIVDGLSERFHLRVSAFSDDGLRELQYSAIDSPKSMVTLPTGRFSTTTDLGSPVEQSLEQSSSSLTDILLLSDGGHNANRPPLPSTVRDQLGPIRLHAIGFGSPNDVQDYALVAVDSPPEIGLDDVAIGSLKIRESFPEGSAYRITATVLSSEDPRPSGDEVVSTSSDVWAGQFVSTASDERIIPFELAPIPKRIRSDSSRIQTRTVRFTITATDYERYTDNNQTEIVIGQRQRKNRMLIVADRPRWEIRYLKNLFDRDPNWEVDFIVDAVSRDRISSDRTLGSRQASSTRFPESIEELSEYDVVLLGEVSPSAFASENQAMLFEAIDKFGLGLVMIDGQYGLLHDVAFDQLTTLLPVSPDPKSALIAGPLAVERVQNPRYAFLRLFGSTFETQDDSLNNQSSRLVPFSSARRVQAKPGAEVLAYLVANRSREVSTASTNPTDPTEQFSITDWRVPWLVTQRIGLGRVSYVSSDETWRWRYAAEDRNHAAFWKPLVDWTAREQYDLENDTYSLDVHQTRYTTDDVMQVKMRLKPATISELKRRGETNAFQLRLRSQDDSERIVSLYPTGELDGLYESEVQLPTSGIVRVSLLGPGLGSDEQSLAVSVVTPPNLESLKLECDADLLRDMTQAGNGFYAHSSEAEELVLQLESVSQASTVRNSTLLRSSYWWFIPTILLLGCEWLLRKRIQLL